MYKAFKECADILGENLPTVQLATSDMIVVSVRWITALKHTATKEIVISLDSTEALVRTSYREVTHGVELEYSTRRVLVSNDPERLLDIVHRISHENNIL